MYPSISAVSMTGGESMDREPLRLEFNTASINITGVAGETVILPCTVENKKGLKVNKFI